MIIGSGALIIAYLLGSIPFGYIMVKHAHGTDIRSVGSGNIGATNVYRKSRAGRNRDPHIGRGQGLCRGPRRSLADA